MEKVSPIKLKAIKMVQFKYDLFLTIMTKKDLLQLEDSKCLKVDKYQTDEADAYQRAEEPKRINELANYLTQYKDDELVVPLLPASIVINVPDDHDIDFNKEDDTLIIKRSAKLFIVDGQHRIAGIIKAIKEQNDLDIEIPVTLIVGMKKFQEAAQFLILNVKQKPVRTDLALTVLYKMDKNNSDVLINSLKHVLKVALWKLEATAIALEINSNDISPWENKIIGPNQDVASLRAMGIKWAPIKQAAFVDTLRSFCSLDLPLLDLTKKSHFLIKLWNRLKQYYNPAFDPETGKNYMLLRGLGVGPVNILARLLYVLEVAKYEDLDSSLKTLVKKYPLRFWDKSNREGINTWGSSQKDYNNNAKAMARKVFPQLYDYWDEKTLMKYYKDGTIDDTEEDKIRDLFNPFNLKPFDLELIEKDIKTTKSGCYVLIDKSKSGLKAYCGQSIDLKERIQKHNRKFMLFNTIDIEAKSIDTIESVLYHLIQSEYRTNDAHPPNCPICKKK